MAVYGYRCPACGAEQERKIAIADYDSVAAKQRCDCGGLMTRTFTGELHVVSSGRWRDEVASIGPAGFMRREESRGS